MKHLLIVLCVILLGLVLLGCGGMEEEPIEEGQVIEGKADFPGSTCTFKCTACQPSAKRCNQVCTWVGNCNTRCTAIEDCSDGFKWSENACRCLPDHP